MAEDLDFPHQRLRFARKRKFKSAAAAAKALGVEYPTYAGHENGNRENFIENAELYARRFGVTFEWLWTGNEPMDRNTPVRDAIADLSPDKQRLVTDLIEALKTQP